MNVSLNIILDRLSPYQIETHIPVPSERKVSRLEMLPASLSDLDPDRLYLCRLSQVIALPADQRKGCVLLCLRDRIKDAGETEELLDGTIIVNENLSYEHLFTFIQDTFCEIETWYITLQNALIQNLSLQDILDLSEPFLQNYVQITDSSFKLLAYTRHTDCDEEITVLARQYGYHPEKTVETFRKNRRIEVWEKTSGLLINDEHTFLKYTAISKIFKFSNTYFAHAVMSCCNSPCTAGIIDRFSMLSEILSVYIEKEWDNTNNWHHIYDPFLTDIYEGNITRKDVAEERSRHVGIPLNGVFCLSLTSPEESGKYALGKIAQEISAVRPNDRVTLWRGRVAILSLFSPKRYLEQFRQARDDLESVMEKFDLRCGMSAIFSDLLGAEKGIRQAQQALTYSGRTIGSDLIPDLEGGLNSLKQRVVFFEESFSHILLGNDPNNRDIWKSSVYYEALKNLQIYDQQHNLNNLHLLYVYLICESRPTDTGNILHMSRNNVVYRISRIEDMLHLDLQSAAVRFKLLISYTLAQLYGLD